MSIMISEFDNTHGLNVVTLNQAELALVADLFGTSTLDHHKVLSLISSLTDKQFRPAARAVVIDSLSAEISSPILPEIIKALTVVEDGDDSLWLRALARDAKEFLNTFYDSVARLLTFTTL